MSGRGRVKTVCSGDYKIVAIGLVVAGLGRVDGSGGTPTERWGLARRGSAYVVRGPPEGRSRQGRADEPGADGDPERGPDDPLRPGHPPTQGRRGPATPTAITKACRRMRRWEELKACRCGQCDRR